MEGTMSKSEQDFFDQLAERWDDMRSLDSARIEGLVNMVGFQEGDHVLDVGCGTGVLVPFVQNVIGERGLVTSVDFSSKMIERAIEKHKERIGVKFVVADIMKFQPECDFDKIICFNFFPHVTDKSQFLKKMLNMLAKDGCLVIMHDISRVAVNSIHGQCDAVKNDRLAEGDKIANLFTEFGYHVTEIVDNDVIYFIKGLRANC